jgi:hypothetical protein
MSCLMLRNHTKVLKGHAASNIINPEDGGRMFLRNVGIQPEDAAQQPTRPQPKSWRLI